MIYLTHFSFPSLEEEYTFHFHLKRTCYDTLYPFGILSKRHLECLDFEPVTILYGGNGSGKTTALNVMAEKLGLPRDTPYNRSNFFEDYTDRCGFQLAGPAASLPAVSRVITSDDVFDFMLNIRTLNQGIDRKREELFDEYLEAKYSHFQMRSLADYEELKKVSLSRSKTQSKFVREMLMDNVREHSNGESAFLYFQEKMQEAGLYLLDEPENSLSPERQQELAQFLENSARFFDCQLIIATHSPFLLAIHGAKIYDLDEDPVDEKKWTQLSNVRAYYDFFQAHSREFT
ncbi:MAG TPA: AAA family ATPase [Candidatus Pullilachnospira gallistercoris]|uniref:AAA family ATPase n=1 Tax=Candidatus Pullilachnospira gallistercoris TaxID=2840911 RepID=A0A9D1EB49_9FIRM|nr:AAA family ATPase [Candidatus Pullilachnospira gallistercoris]